jgi:hypothetical protein
MFTDATNIFVLGLILRDPSATHNIFGLNMAIVRNISLPCWAGTLFLFVGIFLCNTRGHPIWFLGDLIAMSFALGFFSWMGWEPFDIHIWDLCASASG